MATDPTTGEEIDEDNVPLFSRTLPAGASDEDKDIALSGMLSAVNSGQDDVINAPDKGDLVASYGDLNAPIQSRLNTARNLNKEIQDITNERTVLGRDLSEPSRIRGSEALGLTVSSVLPILIGAALQGRKGALAGAQAGFSGGAVGVKGLEEEAKEADKIKSEQFKDLGLLRREKLKQASANEEAIADYQGTLAKDKLNNEARDRRAELFANRPTVMEKALGKEGAKNYYQLQLENLQKNIDNKNKIDPAALKTIGGSQAKIRGYQEIAKLVTGSDVDRADFDKLSSEFKKEMIARFSEGRGGEHFRDGEEVNLVSDIAARAGVDPNSPSALAFRRMFEMGREVSIAQAGTATNQDVAQEVFKTQIAPLERVETYLGRLQANVAREKASLRQTLLNEKLNGKGAADVFVQQLEKDGYLTPEDSQVKVVNGVSWRRVNGGWEKVR